MLTVMPGIRAHGEWVALRGKIARPRNFLNDGNSVTMSLSFHTSQKATPLPPNSEDPPMYFIGFELPFLHANPDSLSVVIGYLPKIARIFIVNLQICLPKTFSALF